MRARDSVLWKIEGDGIHTSYLLGSMHVPIAHSIRAREELLNFMVQSKCFLAETSFDVAYDVRSSENWSSYLKPSEKDKWRDLLRKRYGLTLSAFYPYPPLILYNFMSIQDLGLSNGKAMDQELWDMAASMGLECRGLIPPDEHYGVLNKLSIALQLKWIRIYLNNYSKSRRMMRSVLKQYENQRIHTLYRLTTKSLGASKKILLFDRNVKMSQSILTEAASAPVFAVVGAAHLSGGNGVLHLLNREKEIRIRALL